MCQLQILQGKENLLQHFLPNYANITKGFMHFLKLGVHFFWDELAQCSFDASNKALISTPFLSPPDYNKHFLLYLAAAKSSRHGVSSGG
jgi:hypothetical protein